jgi:hypothetical protein
MSGPWPLEIASAAVTWSKAPLARSLNSSTNDKANQSSAEAAVRATSCDNLSVLCSRSLYAVAFAKPLACSRTDPDVVTLDGGFSHSAAAMPKEPTLFD